MPTLVKIARWVAGKLAGAALILVVGVALLGLWLFLKDTSAFDRQWLERLEQLAADRAHLEQARAALDQKMAELSGQMQVQQQRAAQAEKIVAALREMESWWDRVFGNPAQRQANLEQQARMEKIKAEATTTAAGLRQQIVQAGWEIEGAELALARLLAEINRVEASRADTLHYLHRAWAQSKWYLGIALVGFFFGPTVWALSMYYGFGAIAARARPIRLVEAQVAPPAVGESRVSVTAQLQEGDVLRVREKFLQSSDEGVVKSTRFVLDWRIPLTSLACGLVELIELRGTKAGGHAVTLSNADDPHLELAVIEVPEGGSLILRPSFLAGVIQREKESLRIARHWRVFRWHAWISGQFRFFEFIGPCRLVVAGSRGVRAEELVSREGVSAPARRTNQDATIGFTPNLSYQPVRAETFWSYYRGMHPLFDDLFAGQGMFLLQETSTPGAGAKAGRFWSGIWNAVLKVFGL
jgi:hypothetical protein